MDKATLEILRQRRGLSASDTSADAAFDRYSGRDIFEELIAWELGSSNLAGWVIWAIEKSGGKIVWGPTK